jgi:DNA-binding transcriptional MerR regulator
MTTYRIAEVARRSGYSAPALRYYETIGLLPPAQRSENGYRLYDDATLDRLAFITRAKQLGCTLDEVGELATAWDGGECAPVKHRLQALIDAKLGDAERRIAELTTLVADLHHATTTLADHTPDGPCDADCGCTAPGPQMADAGSPRPAAVGVALGTKPTEPARAAGAAEGAEPGSTDGQPAAVRRDAVTVTLGTKPVTGEVPIACSLDGEAVGRRLDDWQALLGTVIERTAIDGGVRLAFAARTPTESIAGLAAAEHDCCRFFAFALTIDQRGPALEVRAPAEALDLVTALFGDPA